MSNTIELGRNVLLEETTHSVDLKGRRDWDNFMQVNIFEDENLVGFAKLYPLSDRVYLNWFETVSYETFAYVNDWIKGQLGCEDPWD